MYRLKPGGAQPHCLPGYHALPTGRLATVPLTQAWARTFLCKSKSMYGNYLAGAQQIPYHLWQTLRFRDTAAGYDTDACHRLLQAYNFHGASTATNTHSKGVYIWVHTALPKVYVGSYWTHHLTHRTQQHLASANSTGWQSTTLPRWHALTATAPRQLYTQLYQQGTRDWYVFPLQLLPSNTTARDVRICEQQWIQRYQSLVPRGYNHRNASVEYVPDDLRYHRQFASRDMCRRVYACYKAST